MDGEIGFLRIHLLCIWLVSLRLSKYARLATVFWMVENKWYDWHASRSGRLQDNGALGVCPGTLLLVLLQVLLSLLLLLLLLLFLIFLLDRFRPRDFVGWIRCKWTRVHDACLCLRFR